MGRVVFYARVSTRDQKLDLQLDAARKLGVKTADIFIEKASGIRHDRPELAKALAALKPGDTLATYKLDRIGRSLVHVSNLLAELEERSIHFRTVEDGLSTQGSTGKLVLHVLGAVAQFRARPDPRTHTGRPGGRKEARHAARPAAEVVARHGGASAVPDGQGRAQRRRGGQGAGYQPAHDVPGAQSGPRP